MNCPHCGYIVPENTKFCGNCGKPLPEELTHAPKPSAYPFREPASPVSAHTISDKNTTSTEKNGPETVDPYQVVWDALTFKRCAFIGLIAVLLLLFIGAKQSMAITAVFETADEIRYCIEGMNLEKLSSYLTEESKENIVQVLSEDEYIGVDISEFISEGKDFAYILNKYIAHSQFQFLVELSSTLLRDIHWLSFDCFISQQDVSFLGRRVTVSYYFFSYDDELTFVKEDGKWLVSLSKEDIRHILSSLKDKKGAIKDQIIEKFNSE